MARRVAGLGLLRTLLMGSSEVAVPALGSEPQSAGLRVDGMPGLIIGASAMSAVFALGVGTDDFAHATPADIEAGRRLTFLLAGCLMFVAICIAFTNRFQRTMP